MTCRHCGPPRTLAQRIVAEVMCQQPKSGNDVAIAVSTVDAMLDNEAARTPVWPALVLALMAFLVGTLHGLLIPLLGGSP